MKLRNIVLATGLLAASGCASRYETIDHGFRGPTERMRRDSSLFSVVVNCPDSAGVSKDRIDNVRKYVRASHGGIYIYTDTTSRPPGAYKLRYNCTIQEHG